MKQRLLVDAALVLVLAAWLLLALSVADGAGATAAVTLACALAFAPLRARLRDIVERRFNRARYETVRRIEGFVDDVREGRAAPEEVEDVLADALGDARLTLRFRLASGRGYVDRAGHPAAAAAPGLAATPVQRRGVELGVLLHDPALRRELLHAALLAAGLAIEVARLRADVAVQVDAVRASRARIATLEDAERRRVRAELERGAGRRLDALERALGSLADAGLAAPVADALSELEDTRAELARLTAAPAALTGGLAAALRELAARTAAPISVDLDLEPVSPEIERTAYFVAAEAVTNAVKHADASLITIRALALDQGLVLRVVDDGRGGAGFAEHGGLAGLRERVEAVGGTLQLRSGTAGTAVEAVFRCG